MSLYKRGGVWWTYVWMDGVRHAKSTGTGNRRLAEQIQSQFQDELVMKRCGINQLAPDMPFGELAARFLGSGSPKPYHLERLQPLLPFWSEIPIGSIAKSQANDYRRYRHELRANLSDTTINRDLEALRHILFWAVDEGLLRANPLSRMALVRPRRKPRIVLSLAEEENLLAAAAPHLRAIAIASLDSGMRRGEILAERWEHVDFDRRLLSVTHSKTPGGEGREIPLSARLFELLNAKRQEEGFVFTFKGAPIKKIKTAWKAAIRRAGIRYLRFHDLRHTFNTRLMEAGVVADVRRSLMGHSTGADVNAIYTHIDVTEKRKAIRKLEEWIAAQVEERRKEATEASDRTEPRPYRRSDSQPGGVGGERGIAELPRSLGPSSQPRARCRYRRADGTR